MFECYAKFYFGDDEHFMFRANTKEECMFYCKDFKKAGGRAEMTIKEIVETPNGEASVAVDSSIAPTI